MSSSSVPGDVGLGHYLSVLRGHHRRPRIRPCLVRRLMSKPLGRLKAFVDSCDPLRIAVGIAIVGALLSAGLYLAFDDLFGAMFALAADPSTTADISILSPLRQNLHRNHTGPGGHAEHLLGLCQLVLVPTVGRRAKDPSIIQILKWGTVAVAFITLAFAAAPRRILWERFPVVTFDNRIGFVIGNVGSEALVYVPSEPGRPRVRKRADALLRPRG